MWFIDVFMQGMCHYAEELKRNLVDDKQPPVQEASQKEPVKSKSSSPLQHTPPKPKPYQPKNKVSYDLNMSINRRSLKKKNRYVEKNTIMIFPFSGIVNRIFK